MINEMVALQGAMLRIETAIATRGSGLTSRKIPAPYNVAISKCRANWDECVNDPTVKPIYIDSWRWSCGACWAVSELHDTWDAAYRDSQEHLASPLHLTGMRASIGAIHFAQTGHVS